MSLPHGQCVARPTVTYIWSHIYGTMKTLALQEILSETLHKVAISQDMLTHPTQHEEVNECIHFTPMIWVNFSNKNIKKTA